MTRPLLDLRPSTGAPDNPPAGLDRLRVLAAVAMGTILVSYALFVPVAAAMVRTGAQDITTDAAFAAAVPLWLAAHQVPLVIQGQPLSVLPLLPTIAVVAVVAFGSAWAIRRLGGRPLADTGAILATVAGAHAAVAVLGSALLPPELAAGPWPAMLAAALVTALGVALGALRAAGSELRALLLAWPTRPGWLVPGLRGAVVGGSGLLAVGAAVLSVALAAGAGDVEAAYARLAPDAAAGIGVTILACAYLPNAAVAALSWALGSGVGVGAATASPFWATAPDQPSSFPLLAALPAEAPGPAVVVIALPVAVGVLVGRAVVRACDPASPPWIRASAAAAGSATTAVIAGALAVLAGGRLASGPYDPVDVPSGLVALAVLLWVGLPATLAAVVTGPRTRMTAVEAARARRARTQREPGVHASPPASRTSVSEGASQVAATPAGADPGHGTDTGAVRAEPIAGVGRADAEEATDTADPGAEGAEAVDAARAAVRVAVSPDATGTGTGTGTTGTGTTGTGTTTGTAAGPTAAAGPAAGQEDAGLTTTGGVPDRGRRRGGGRGVGRPSPVGARSRAAGNGTGPAVPAPRRPMTVADLVAQRSRDIEHGADGGDRVPEGEQPADPDSSGDD